MGIALDNAIAWKKALIRERLKYAEKEMPNGKQRIARYKEELEVLKVPDGRAYDLAMRNLDLMLEMAREGLAAHEGMLAHKPGPMTDDDKRTTASHRCVIDETRGLRDDLKKRVGPNSIPARI